MSPRPRRALRLLAVLLPVWLAACRSLPTAAPDLGLTADWPTRQAALQAIRQFECAGRVAVSARDQGFNAQFLWRQNGDRAYLNLRGPFGSGGLIMESQGDAIALTLADGRRLDGDAARVELERTIGALLPVTAVGYWLLGTPQPEYPGESVLARPAPAAAGMVGEGGRPAQLETLTQRAWNVSYRPHEGTPRQLTLQGGDARLRIVIERWNWGPPRS